MLIGRSEHLMNLRLKNEKAGKIQRKQTQEPNSAVKAPTVLAPCPGTVGSLLGAAFLAVKADHALCHSWGAVLPNCLFSTTLSSISLLTAPLQSENANKDRFSCQISGNHTAPGTTQCESLWRGCCAKRDSIYKTNTKSGHLPHNIKIYRLACLCLKS